MCVYEDVSDEKRSRPWVCTANCPAGPPIDYTPPDYPSLVHPFLIEKATIGQFSDKEWASEGAYGGHVDENGSFSSNKTRFALTKMPIPFLKIDQ